MRIRQIKPDYWRDRTLGTLTPAVREFYIGLWMEADDTGWLRWAPGEIGADLYPYRSPARRERDIIAYAVTLTEQSRLVIHDCGHAFIPTLVKHQRSAGGTRRMEAFAKEHSGCIAERRGKPRDSAPERNGTERNGTERNGSDLTTTEDELRRMVDDPDTAPAARRAAEKALARMGVRA